LFVSEENLEGNEDGRERGRKGVGLGEKIVPFGHFSLFSALFVVVGSMGIRVFHGRWKGFTEMPPSEAFLCFC